MPRLTHGLGNAEENAGHHPTNRTTQVDHLRDRHDPHAPVAPASEHAEPLELSTRDPVELPDDDGLESPANLRAPTIVLLLGRRDPAVAGDSLLPGLGSCHAPVGVNPPTTNPRNATSPRSSRRSSIARRAVFNPGEALARAHILPDAGSGEPDGPNIAAIPVARGTRKKKSQALSNLGWMGRHGDDPAARRWSPSPVVDTQHEEHSL